jgi:Na+-driven multidrug efflux pump
MACGTGGGFLVGVGFIFFFGARPLTSFFTGGADNATAELAVPLLRLVAWSMPSLALTMILTGALRGAGDTRWPFVFTLIGFVGIRIPLSTLLAWPTVTLPLVDITIGGFGFGVLGAWYAMLVDVVLRSVLVVLRFRHGGWQRVQV